MTTNAADNRTRNLMLIFFERHLIALPDKAQERILTYCFPSFRQKFPSVSIPIWSSLVSSPQKAYLLRFPIFVAIHISSFNILPTQKPATSISLHSHFPLSISLFFYACLSKECSWRLCLREPDCRNGMLLHFSLVNAADVLWMSSRLRVLRLSLLLWRFPFFPFYVLRFVVVGVVGYPGTNLKQFRREANVFHNFDFFFFCRSSARGWLLPFRSRVPPYLFLSLLLR